MAKLFESVKLGPVELRNRVIKAATFEGATPEGLVTEELIEYHRRVAAGGVGMTTVAYLAVAPEGRTHRECIQLVPEAVPGLRKLTDSIKAEGALAAAQIGHAGPVANASSNGVRSLSAGRMFNPLGLRFTKAADESDIARVTADYSRATEMAIESGFDSLEVHIGHNYLLSAFLSPQFNKRTDRYGGSIENRARFAREVMEAVRSRADGRAAITAKLNMVDGYPSGLRIEDSLKVAKWLEDDGVLDAIELTAGSSLANPMYLFKGGVPVHEFTGTLPWYLRPGFKLVGKKFLRKYPYEEGYFLPMARQFRQELKLPVILLGGISNLETAQSAVDEGFEFVAMARALLHNPDLLRGYQEGSGTTSGCIHCNRCMATIYTGTRCPLVDPRPGDRPFVDIA